MTDPQPSSDPVELTVQRMAELHAQHASGRSTLQKAVESFTGRLARPRSLIVALGLVIVWMVSNVAAPLVGLKPLDEPPFAILELVATVVALLTTLMILATQAREEEAARHRSQLTLQLASLTEQKIAKVISLLEEQRRDSAHLPDRPDLEAQDMARPADPGHVLERIKDTHDGA